MRTTHGQRMEPHKVKKILDKSKRLFEVDIVETIKWEPGEEAWDYERAIAGRFLLVTTMNLPPNQICGK